MPDALININSIGGVTTLTLNSPNNANALSHALIAELTTAIESAPKDGARVLVLTHTDTSFCAGADLTESATDNPPVLAIPRLLRAIWESSLPVVAVTKGATRGGGLGLLCAADIAIGTPETTFAFSEVRVGVVPAAISPVIAARLTPRARGELMLTGRTFTGVEAERIGLLTRCVTADQLEPTLAQLLAEISRGAPGALAATKRLANAQALGDLDSLAGLSAWHFGAPEGQEGISAAQERRPPSWLTA